MRIIQAQRAPEWIGRTSALFLKGLGPVSGGSRSSLSNPVLIGSRTATPLNYFHTITGHGEGTIDALAAVRVDLDNRETSPTK